jgi:phage shock protein A
MTTLRPIAIRRPPVRDTVESLTQRISTLTTERQTLRLNGASEPALERNRVQIARAQWELSYALIERYLPNPAEQAA